MAYLLQHLLTDSAARQPDRPAVAAGGQSPPHAGRTPPGHGEAAVAPTAEL
jgi:hypothetical protein